MFTAPTPRTFSSRFFSTWSAQLVSAIASGGVTLWPLGAVSPCRAWGSGSTASDQTAVLAGSKRMTRGSLTSSRRVGRTEATFSRTSSAARRPSICSWNSMMTTLVPS
jgi:hypothetical protein